MAKRINLRTEWITSGRVTDIFSVSNCISKCFADDYIDFWKHNGYWFFDAPAIIQQLGRERSIDLTEMRLFFYEAHELAFNGVEG